MATETYYVIDSENNTLWQGKERDDAPQVFRTFKAAEKRAHEAADCAPGVQFKIAKVVAFVESEALPAKTEKAG